MRRFSYYYNAMTNSVFEYWSTLEIMYTGDDLPFPQGEVVTINY